MEEWERIVRLVKKLQFLALVDYVIRSPYILPYVQNFQILDFDPLFSDVHCGISFVIRNITKVRKPLYEEEKITGCV